jgi:HlyD family secretion protein
MRMNYSLPIAAAFGLIVAITAVILGAQKPPTRPILFPPSTSPFENSIAGVGILEANTDNINIGSPFNEVIVKQYVKSGDVVKEGDPLFELDIRSFVAQRDQGIADKQRAEVEYENASKQLEIYDAVQDKRAISQSVYTQVFFAKQTAQASIQQAQARIDLAQSFIDRSLVRAPTDGKVLSVSLHKGEVANLNPFNGTAVMTFGPVCPYQVKVYIDEDDVWRFQPNTKAVAYVRGNSSISFPLKYSRTLPLMIPKDNFTRSNDQRIDTRVLKVLYHLDCNSPFLYAGQVLDIYIESISPTTRY